MAVGSGRTCLAFRQRDFCHTHSKLVEANHLNEFTYLKHRIACQNFIHLQRNTPLEYFQENLRLGIIGLFKLLKQELKDLERDVAELNI